MEKKIWKIKWFLKNFWEDQRGMGVVEVILIIVENQRDASLVCFVQKSEHSLKRLMINVGDIGTDTE